MLNLILLPIAISKAIKTDTTPYFKHYLDDIDKYFGGDGSYDPIFFAKLEKCAAKLDDDLLMKS